LSSPYIVLPKYFSCACSVNVYEDLVFGHFGKVGVELEVSKYKNLYVICVLVPIQNSLISSSISNGILGTQKMGPLVHVNCRDDTSDYIHEKNTLKE